LFRNHFSGERETIGAGRTQMGASPSFGAPRRLLPLIKINTDLREAVPMMTYYDHRLGKERIKRRYSWAAGAFVAGLAFGVVAAHIL
jgi:hypothetical protein